MLKHKQYPRVKQKFLKNNIHLYLNGLTPHLNPKRSHENNNEIMQNAHNPHVFITKNVKCLAYKYCKLDDIMDK